MTNAMTRAPQKEPAMNIRKTPELLCVAVTVAAVLSTFSVGAISAPSPADARYQRDRADCLAGKSGESRQACLREAAAALQAARKRQLATPDPAQLAANERKRCEPLRGDD